MVGTFKETTFHLRNYMRKKLVVKTYPVVVFYSCSQDIASMHLALIDPGLSDFIFVSINVFGNDCHFGEYGLELL